MKNPTPMQNSEIRLMPTAMPVTVEMVAMNVVTQMIIT